MVRPRFPALSALAAVLVGTVASLGIAMAPAHAACPATPDCPLPAPSGLAGVSSTATTMNVAWSAVDTAPGYRLQYSRQADFSSGVYGVKTTNTTYALSSLSPETTYYLRVAVATQVTPTEQLSQWSGVIEFRTLRPFGLKVGTYNIKDPDSTAQGPWSTRGPRSAATIVGQGVKIAGLQELYEDQNRRNMVKLLTRATGDVPYFAMVPDPNTTLGKDSRIVYDQRVLQHIRSGGKIFDYQFETEQRAFAWGKFLHKPSGAYVLFITSHLEHQSDTADVEQWRELLRFAHGQVAGPNVQKPWKVVIAADFNVSKWETIGADMFAESREAGFEDVVGQKYRSYDTYRSPATKVDAWISSSNRGKRDIRKYSVSKDRIGNGIDHILVSKALKVPYFRVYAQPRTGHIMNYLMSDHFLVIAKITE